jgi:large subunit ribosomal protein L15e
MAEKQKAEKQIKEKKEAKKSVKGFYHFIKQKWKKPNSERVTEIRNLMTKWRAEDRIVRLDKPTRLDRARNLGYKAKKGVIVFRVAVKRGGRKKPRINIKRRSKRMSVRKILKMNYQWVAEQRVQHKYPNLEILNSYKLAKDGKYFYFDVIAIDPSIPEIKSDSNLNWICKPENRNRTFRGLTSAAKKSRGLTSKSPNLKVRPSLRAWKRHGR